MFISYVASTNRWQCIPVNQVDFQLQQSLWERKNWEFISLKIICCSELQYFKSSLPSGLPSTISFEWFATAVSPGTRFSNITQSTALKVFQGKALQQVTSAAYAQWLSPECWRCKCRSTHRLNHIQYLHRAALHHSSGAVLLPHLLTRASINAGAALSLSRLSRACQLSRPVSCLAFRKSVEFKVFKAVRALICSTPRGSVWMSPSLAGGVAV